MPNLSNLTAETTQTCQVEKRPGERPHLSFNAVLRCTHVVEQCADSSLGFTLQARLDVYLLQVWAVLDKLRRRRLIVAEDTKNVIEHLLQLKLELEPDLAYLILNSSSLDFTWLI